MSLIELSAPAHPRPSAGISRYKGININNHIIIKAGSILGLDFRILKLSKKYK
jgi:hypothetical protein